MKKTLTKIRNILPASDVLTALFVALNAIVADVLLARQLSLLFSSQYHSGGSATHFLIIAVLYSVTSNILNGVILADITFRRGSELFSALVRAYGCSPYNAIRSVNQETLANLAIVQITNICGGIILPFLTLLSSSLIMAALLIFLIYSYTVFAVILLSVSLPFLFLLIILIRSPMKTLGTNRLRHSQRLSLELYNIMSKSLLMRSAAKSMLLIQSLSFTDSKLRDSEKRFLIFNTLPSGLIDALLVASVTGMALLSINRPGLFSGALLSSSAFILLRIVSNLKSAQASYNKIISYKPALNEYLTYLRKFSKTSSYGQDNDRNIYTPRSSGALGAAALKEPQERIVFSRLENRLNLEKYVDSIVFGAKNLITGPSGSGKSTFVRDFLEYQLSLSSPSSEFIFIDQFSVVFPWSALENILLFEKQDPKHESSIKYILQKYKLLEYFGDNPFSLSSLDRPVPDLSGGELQRFCLIRALYKKHDFVIIDEPLSGQDPSMAHILIESLNEYHLAYPNVTLIVISHNLPKGCFDDWNRVKLFDQRESPHMKDASSDLDRFTNVQS